MPHPPPGDSTIFGLSFTPEDSSLILLPVPWEATVSYRGGTSEGPAAILRASHQVDLLDLSAGTVWEAGICMVGEAEEIWDWGQEARELARVARSDGVPSEEDSPAARSRACERGELEVQTGRSLRRGQAGGSAGWRWAVKPPVRGDILERRCGRERFSGCGVGFPDREAPRAVFRLHRTFRRVPRPGGKDAERARLWRVRGSRGCWQLRRAW